MLTPLSLIPMVDLLRRPVITAVPTTGLLADQFARELRDLRISVTDRCNFRCVYCMPKAAFGRDHAFMAQSSLLTFEEIERLARIFIRLGVEKIRLTGGEPLLRKDIERLIERLASMTTARGLPLDISLTTNGSLLAQKARALKDAGLSRVTVSLDALNDTLFKQMNDVGFPVADVLKGIDAAHTAGLAPIKINMVVKRGTNDQEILPLASLFRGSGITLRFIEFMDVGTSNQWKMSEVMPSDEVVSLINNQFPLYALDSMRSSDTSQRWGYRDGSGEIGVISSVTHAFCGACSRARLSAEGRLYSCLFSGQGHDLRTLVREGWSDDSITTAIACVWEGRTDRYSALRSSGNPMASDAEMVKVEMSYIGG
jgi:cyclic pyranopterin phosphate synthase